MEMMEVSVASQVIPVHFTMLMHALAESLQFVHMSVPGRSQSSLSAAASTGLSSASVSEHHCDIIIVTTRTITTNRCTCNMLAIVSSTSPLIKSLFFVYQFQNKNSVRQSKLKYLIDGQENRPRPLLSRKGHLGIAI